MVDQNSQFYAILTNIGAAKQANADALGIPWKITQMAIGDGNPGGVENPPLPMPSASATALLNEWRRAPLNQLKVDEVNNAVIVAEQIIPADVGGHWIREIALYDADGDMVAVANCPATYKPLLNQGSGRTQVVRMTEGTYRSVTVDKYGHVIAATNPTTVAGYGLTDVYTKNEIDTVLALKAPLASPVFTGVPKAPTPAQFDASELIATMKAVQRALGNASDFEELEADRVITAADAGKTFMLAAPSVVITFPDSTTLPKGFEVTVLSAGGTSGTLAGSTFVSSRGSSITGIEGFSLRLHARKSTNQYRVSHWGDGASSLAGAGYQRFASGLIIQWGLANSSASGTDTTFPIAFPRAVLRVVATPVNYAVPISVVSSNTKITVTAASSTPGCNYLAVGY